MRIPFLRSRFLEHHPLTAYDGLQSLTAACLPSSVECFADSRRKLSKATVTFFRSHRVGVPMAAGRNSELIAASEVGRLPIRDSISLIAAPKSLGITIS